jgi:acyl-CoA synthetase (AMP-forming)/AMP-acid ligase II
MFIDFILDAFEKNAGKEAFVSDNTVFTYTSLLDTYHRWHEYVQKTFRPGEVVALHSDFSPDSIALFLSLIENRNCFVPLSLSNENIPEKLRLAEASWYIHYENNKLVSKKTGITSSHPLILQLQKDNKPGIIIFSSGSTGEPKAALHDFSLLLNKFKKPGKTLRTINFLLFDHWGGVNTLLHILSNGGLVIIPSSRSPEHVCELIQKYKAELLPATPTFLHMILLSEAWRNYDLSSLKMITYGTEVMPESTLQKIHSVFPSVELKQTYGLTELGVMRTKSRSSGSLWVKIGGEDYQTKVVDNILFIKAKTTILGYLNAEVPVDAEGWYNTGDKVETDGEWIKILGRESDMINVGGLKVFPSEVESAMMRMPQVKDCSVYGAKNIITGQTVIAQVVPSQDADTATLKADIRNFLKTCLDSYKIPSKIVFTDTIAFSERFKKIRQADVKSK